MPAQKNSPLAHRRLFLTSLLGWAACFAIASERLRGLLVNSTLLASGALAICIPLGTFLAVAIAKTTLPGRRLLESSLLALLFTPLYVQAAAWQAAAGQHGWLTDTNCLAGWYGAIWVHGIAAIPWVVLLVAAALRKIPRELEEEALQDAPPWQVLLRISLPRATAAIAATSLWVTVICFSEITVTDLFQVRTFAEEIYTAASLGTLDQLPLETNLLDAPQLAANDLWLGTLTIVLLVLAALATLWNSLPTADFSSPTEPWRWQLRRRHWGLSLVVWLVIAVVVGAPLMSLLGKAGAQISQSEGVVRLDWSATKAARLIFDSPWQHRRELGWSLAIGSLAACAATTLAIVLAWALRTRRIPLLPTSLLLSLGFAIPGPLLGVGLIHCLNHPNGSLLAPLTWCYDHTLLAPVLAQFLRALPLATLIIGAQFASLPQDTLDSAQSEGARYWRQLLSIALPGSWPAIAAAAAMALIVAIGDLAATLLVAPPGVSTLSIRIFGLLHYGAEDRVSALCLMLALTLAATATLAYLLLRWRNHRSQNL